MSKRLAYLVLLTLSTKLAANATALEFQKFKNYAQGLHAQSETAIKEFSPGKTFENYSESSKEQAYYSGVETEKLDLSHQAHAALEKEPGAKTVVEHFGKDKFEINSKSEVIKKAKLIEEESHAITHGLSNERINCDDKAEDCKLKSHDEICKVSRQLPDQDCTKNLKVRVASEKIHQRADFSFFVPRKWTGLVTVNLITGAMTNVVSGSLSNPLRLNHPCQNLEASIHAITNNGSYADWVSIVSLPSCSNNGLITLNLTKKWSRVYDLTVALTLDASSQPYVSAESWENGCANLEEQAGLCHIKNQVCTEANTTKLIEGLSVTRDCWNFKNTYSCSSMPSENECLSQKERGCLQTNSRCSDFSGPICLSYEQTYSCQEMICATKTPCLKDVFCADGDCVDKQSSQNDEFSQSVSALAVAGEAGQEVSQGKLKLFSGKAVKCKIWVAGAIDCCSNKGWGKSLDLAHCRDEDKALGQAKLDYLAHYLGKYCSEKDLGICLEHKRSYCVFPSKMARIIQEARLTQKGASVLGDAEQPNCDGLTVEELQNLDLSSIDFIEPVYPYGSGETLKEAGIAADLKLQAPQGSDAVESIKSRIQAKMEGS